jgi:hypothetical protein
MAPADDRFWFEIVELSLARFARPVMGEWLRAFGTINGRQCTLGDLALAK